MILGSSREWPRAAEAIGRGGGRALEPCGVKGCRLPISLRSASRRLLKWHGFMAHVRTYLHRVVLPPGKVDEIADPMMLRHFEAAFPLVPSPMAAFQSTFQTSVNRAVKN